MKKGSKEHDCYDIYERVAFDYIKKEAKPKKVNVAWFHICEKCIHGPCCQAKLVLPRGDVWLASMKTKKDVRTFALHVEEFILSMKMFFPEVEFMFNKNNLEEPGILELMSQVDLSKSIALPPCALLDGPTLYTDSREDVFIYKAENGTLELIRFPKPLNMTREQQIYVIEEMLCDRKNKMDLIALSSAYWV